MELIGHLNCCFGIYVLSSRAQEADIDISDCLDSVHLWWTPSQMCYVSQAACPLPFIILGADTAEESLSSQTDASQKRKGKWWWVESSGGVGFYRTFLMFSSASFLFYCVRSVSPRCLPFPFSPVVWSDCVGVTQHCQLLLSISLGCWHQFWHGLLT